MKRLLISAMLLAAASAFGALTQATGDRLTDYTNWFAPEFDVASDANYIGVPHPTTNDPAPFVDANRSWSGWTQNWGPGLIGPIVGTAEAGLVTRVEFAFLGETAGWWDDIGYRLNGVDYLLADGVQAAGVSFNREFGDYAEWTLAAGDTLDFFVTGSGIMSQDGVITTGSTGGKYYVFDKTLNTPASATMQSYNGLLAPLTNTRAVDADTQLSDQAFWVMGFEDIRLRANSDMDYNDLLFAFRSDAVKPIADPVPEPSTYGLIGAAALLALAGYRRFKKV